MRGVTLTNDRHVSDQAALTRRAQHPGLIIINIFLSKQKYFMINSRMSCEIMTPPHLGYDQGEGEIIPLVIGTGVSSSCHRSTCGGDTCEQETRL